MNWIIRMYASEKCHITIWQLQIWNVLGARGLAEGLGHMAELGSA